MQILLDTHVVLWALVDDPPLPPEHAAAVEGLPLIHADPFGRMLVAQALVEPMKLLTHDSVLARYDPGIFLS